MEKVNIEKHRKNIGYIFVVLGFLSLAIGIITINTFHLVEEWFRSELPTSFNLGILTIHNPFQWLVVFPILNLLTAFIKITAGFGVLKHKKWARKLSLVIAFFWFFHFPFGTAFSIYILYSFLENGPLNTITAEEANSNFTE